MGIGGQLEHAVLPMVLVFAMIPYLMLNLDLVGKGKGKIFMGDAGSMLIGLSVIWLLIIGSQSDSAPLITFGKQKCNLREFHLIKSVLML